MSEINFQTLVQDWLIDNNILYAAYYPHAGLPYLLVVIHEMKQTFCVGPDFILLQNNGQWSANASIVIQAYDPDLFIKLKEYIYAPSQVQDPCKQVRNEKGY